MWIETRFKVVYNTLLEIAFGVNWRYGMLFAEILPRTYNLLWNWYGILSFLKTLDSFIA